MNRSKQKGTAAESAVVGWLKDHGFPYAERRTLAGSNDKGDVSGIAGVVLEIKDCKRTELAAWVDEAAIEGEHAHADIYAVVHKRPRTSDPGRWYCTLPLEVFAELIR